MSEVGTFTPTPFISSLFEPLFCLLFFYSNIREKFLNIGDAENVVGELTSIQQIINDRIQQGSCETYTLLNNILSVTLQLLSDQSQMATDSHGKSNSCVVFVVGFLLMCLA